MTIQETLQAILTECLSRAQSPGLMADEFEAKLLADPIYVLASKGLKELATGEA